jgi:hypothetical protein
VRPAGVLIVESAFLLGARVRADLRTPGLDDHFAEGDKLDDATALKIPSSSIGRNWISGRSSPRS